jgi:hypothetical protein
MSHDFTFTAALAELGATGRAVIAMRDRTIAAPLAVIGVGAALTAAPTALTEFTAEIGRIPETIIRKALP